MSKIYMPDPSWKPISVMNSLMTGHILKKRMTADKYRSSYENCGKVIKKYSKNVGLDLAEFYYRLLFCFLTGNSDMH